MKTKVSGIILILLGIILGLYVGGWLMFIGGIMTLVNLVISLNHGAEFQSFILAIGIAKILFAGLCGWICALAFIIPGLTLVDIKK